MTTFNGEKYLAPQLESIAGQTTLPAELVICDDRSEDRTLEIVRTFADKAPFPVRVHCNASRLGFRDNFMQAVAHCSADLIAFCDQDDVWEPDKVAVMEAQFADPDVLLAYHNVSLIDADGRSVGRLHRQTDGVVMFPPLTRHPWLVVPGFTQVFRRELTQFSKLHPASDDVDWPGEYVAHDRWFYFLASVLGSIAFVGRPLARYRQHGANAHGAYTDRRSHADRLRRGEHFIRAAADTARNRAELLHAMRDLVPGERRERSLQGIAYYDSLRRRFEARIPVYASPSCWTRLRAMYALFRQGGYSPSYGSARFSVRDFLMDLYLAVPLGPRLRRLLNK